MKKARQKYKDTTPMTQLVIHHEEKESIRLNKFISSTGFCSRREADRYIESGCVCVDGILATTGTKVTNVQEVTVNGKQIKPTKNLVYLVLHKPVGIECTTDQSKKDNIIDYMGYPERIFPIGRLDRDSSGLIMLTNDGDVVNKILRSTNEHEKEYLVTVDKVITKEFLDNMQQGVTIYNPVNNMHQTTKPCTITKVDAKQFTIILSQGLNRQIRRMCTANAYHVNALKRIRIMHIPIDGLQPGEWRYVNEEEIRILNLQLKNDKSHIA